MSDEADRPLTRRERRLRDLEETGGVPAVDLSASPAAPSTAAGSTAAASEDEIEISPLNDDGTPRSRRELRELRDRALAALAASKAAEAAAAEPQQPTSTETAAESESEGLDPSLEETQPFSLADLREIADDQAAAESAEAGDGHGGAADSDDDAESASEADDASASEELLDVDVDVDVDDVDDEASASEESAETNAPEEPKKSYTFPDIAPLDESISVYDDPALRAASGASAAEAGGDFDELISRAVAQEGAASTTNSSALILPNLPDTGELTGRIGETGELFITGSIELPKSLGETGSHAPLHDSLEGDHLDELGLGEIPTSDDLNSPVAAKRAVSAVSAGDAIVAQETKEQSKLPLVLILTGGGLVVAVGALLIWGASAGMFG